jgi:hypothetical protein
VARADPGHVQADDVRSDDHAQHQLEHHDGNREAAELDRRRQGSGHRRSEHDGQEGLRRERDRAEDVHGVSFAQPVKRLG